MANARITNETATASTVERNGETFFVAQWQGPEADVPGWFVWPTAGNGHYTGFVAKCDSRIEAVEWAMGTWRPESYIA